MFSVGIPALQAIRILYRAQFAKSKNGRKIPFFIAKKRQELTTDPWVEVGVCNIKKKM